MSLFETCFKLAAFLVCIGLALELSHKLYWQINKQVFSLNISSFSRSVLSAVTACIPLTAAVGTTALFLKLLHNKSLITLGLSYDGNSMTRVAAGAGIALGCVTIVYLLALLFGYIEIKRSKLSEDCVSCLPLFVGGLIDFFTAAIFEEIIFRGYVFYLLYLSTSNAMITIIASSIIFACAHLVKHQNVPIMYIFNALIFGLLVGVCRYYTGTLWLPIGLHFGWNVVSGPIFGLPFSGRSYDRGVVVSDVSGPRWLTGGLYSFDAGVLGTLSLAIAAVGLIAITPIN